MSYEQGRQFLKCTIIENQPNPLTLSDQSKGIPMPESEQFYNEGETIALPDVKNIPIKERDILKLLQNRRSRRVFNEKEFTIDNISFLLWAMQGVKQTDDGKRVYRTAPSAGARHPFDLYIYIRRTDGIKPGLYRYISSIHALSFVPVDYNRNDELQNFMNRCYNCAIAVFMVAIPYRSEWRYVNYAHKFCAIDVGHIGQNGYLAAEALGIGCCAIGYYEQVSIDNLLGLDGIDEFTCYIEAFGHYQD